MARVDIGPIQSVLLIVNRPAGTGRGHVDLDALRQAFEAEFAPVPQRLFCMTDTHAEVFRQTQAFLAATPGPCCLLAGGGGGTTRAMVHGLLASPSRPLGWESVRLGVLRLGSGNLVARRLGVPADPRAGLRELAEGLLADRSEPGWAYRCTFHFADGGQQIEHGLALASLGQFARVPAEVERWKQAHLGLVRWAVRWVPLETITNVQYALFSLGHAVGCALRPARAEWIEVRQAGRRERLRLLAGVVLNFDLPQLPIRAGCQFSEPRLTVGLLPLASRRQLLAALGHWRDLDGRVPKYTITPEQPVEISYLGPETATVALDEDTLATAARRLTWEVVGPLRFIPGRAFRGADYELIREHHRH